MMMMRRMRLQKSIKWLVAAEILIIASNFISYLFFLNAQIAFLSAFLIILGSLYSYKDLVKKRLQNSQFTERDEIEKIDDPFELYDEEEAQTEKTEKEVDVKALIKEEKQRIKKQGFKNLRSSSKATVSLFRLIPYLFLVIGFVFLSKNHSLMLLPFLSFLALGVLFGYLAGKQLFLTRRS
jgi:Na+/citrate or Na+/malate symporter